MVVRGELVCLQEAIELLELAAMKGDDSLRLEDAFVFVQMFAGGQRPEEARQAFHVAAVLQHLADAGDLLLGETERRKGSADGGGGRR